MCDTMVVFNNDPVRSYFAKNSDREPGELQVVNISKEPAAEFDNEPYMEAHQRYLSHSFPVLKRVFPKYHHRYQAIISKPVWMWGAEMGINEFGLTIGNEAVFSKEMVPPEGLLGMDILRLALHNTKTAGEAVDFIINLIREYPQGGDGGYRHSLKYFNSFLLKDATEAYLLETSAQHWAVKTIKTFATISNSYSITDNYDAVDMGSKKIKSFKAKYENKGVTYVSKGNERRRYSAEFLRDTRIDLSRLKELLRSHMNRTNKMKRGMNSLCVHAGLIHTETTSSFIVDYFNNQFVIWFTGSPHPCVSLYKPLVFRNQAGDLFNNTDFAIDYYRQQSLLTKKMIKHYRFFTTHIKPLRDECENEFSKIVYHQSDDKSMEERCKLCFDLEQDYLRQVDLIFKKHDI